MKNWHVFSVLFLLALVFTGCPGSVGGSDIENPDGNDSIEVIDPINPDPDKPMALLSPDEQKDLLVKVGEELIGVFNPEDQNKAVELADDLYYKYRNYDWDAIGEEFAEEYEDFYSSEFESFFGMPRRMVNAINGKKKASMEDLEILITLSKFGRVIEFDEDKKSVKITKTDDASVTARFSDSDGTKCELKVWGEGKEIEGSYTYEDYHWEWGYDYDGNYYENRVSDGERTIRVKVPTIIKMYFKHGSTSLISMTFKWDTNLKDYVKTSLNLQVTNIVFEEVANVSTSEASAVFSFKYGDKNIITSAVSLPKYELIDWEGGNDITEDEGEDWLEEYEGKYATLLGKLGKGEIKLDILGKIQLKGGVTDGAALIDAYLNWSDKYYSTSLASCEDLCSFLNKYCYLSVYYNNTTTEQAKLLMQPYEYSYDSYDVEPIMYFPYDESKIAVMAYFKSSKFLGLIDLVEDLANGYIALDKHNLIFGGNFELDLDF